MKHKSLVLAAMMALGSLSATTASAAELPSVPHISTSGNAIIKAAPDMATLMINVSETQKSAADAKKKVDERVAKYFDFLKNNGIEKKDIDAANLRTQPEYQYDQKTGKSNITGYRASRSVEVKVHKLDQLNTLLDGALKAGLNEINSVQFSVENPQRYRDEARQKAIENAIQQATALAKGFSGKLGPVYSINYRAPDAVPMPMSRQKYQAALMAAPVADSASETYEPQSIEFSDHVDAVFELQR
ncbi:oxidative stress defense protein [Xenorhabdus sp. 42]|uniref:Oxidative stress defense protein n=1 Tax=Xenorhabdus szentirmaii TaxID=290112 RepID=A0AAW3YUJ0_9GAMM|nr:MULTISPECIES: oxidative stress defense protein [unclassified Xenorhabdus]MBD2780018.1 oxidative stress defense protein [Xenorhabdus sp. 38]MBD2793750.1 oxidative stress defense protein [Xenorhabdus sp. CUL]MBD2801177.1 oxidative stress defense protein [Xenorhabdus sp. M]MBD2805465.1 oxidative stress defense protein [Xenorhabdus sp. ZM]MBD2822241.1 oxidative stress defense protein [Xenorhabdus sp. 42]